MISSSALTSCCHSVDDDELDDVTDDDSDGASVEDSLASMVAKVAEDSLVCKNDLFIVELKTDFAF